MPRMRFSARYQPAAAFSASALLKRVLKARTKQSRESYRIPRLGFFESRLCGERKAFQRLRTF
jgi:hypothetical protein